MLARRATIAASGVGKQIMAAIRHQNLRGGIR
jgi:hypothetical protein